MPPLPSTIVSGYMTATIAVPAYQATASYQTFYPTYGTAGVDYSFGIGYHTAIPRLVIPEAAPEPAVVVPLAQRERVFDLED